MGASLDFCERVGRWGRRGVAERGWFMRWLTVVHYGIGRYFVLVYLVRLS